MGHHAGDPDRRPTRRKTVAGILEESEGRSFFGKPSPTPGIATRHETSPRSAVASLLLAVAYADGVLSAGERRYIEWVLRREFGVDRAEAERLIRDARVAHEGEPDIGGIVGRIAPTLSDGQRRRLARIVEELAHVNRAPTREQEYAVRKTANLLARAGRRS